LRTRVRGWFVSTAKGRLMSDVLANLSPEHAGFAFQREHDEALTPAKSHPAKLITTVAVPAPTATGVRSRISTLKPFLSAQTPSPCARRSCWRKEISIELSAPKVRSTTMLVPMHPSHQHVLPS